jgi:hypothetical protein
MVRSCTNQLLSKTFLLVGSRHINKHQMVVRVWMAQPPPTSTSPGNAKASAIVVLTKAVQIMACSFLCFKGINMSQTVAVALYQGVHHTTDFCIESPIAKFDEVFRRLRLCSLKYTMQGGRGAVTAGQALAWKSQGLAPRVKQEEYFEKTAQFAVYLTQLTGQHPYYLDMHAKITPIPDNLENPSVVVTEEIICNPNKGPFRVIVVSGGTSPDYNNAMLTQTEKDCVFAPGNVAGSKAKARSLRFAAESNQEAYVYGGGKTLIGAVQMTDFEKKKGVGLVKWIMQAQTAMLNTQFGIKSIFQFDCNGRIVNHGSPIGSAFKGHTDGDALTSCDETDSLQVQELLPFLHEQQTVTHTISDDPNAVWELEYINPANHKIVYGRVNLPANCLHIQCHGSQSHAYHQVNLLHAGDASFRQVSSYRHLFPHRSGLLTRRCNEKVSIPYKDRRQGIHDFHIITKQPAERNLIISDSALALQNNAIAGAFSNQNDESEMGGLSETVSVQEYKLPTDNYVQSPAEPHPEALVSYIAAKDRLPFFLTRADVVTRLMEEKITVTVRDGRKKAAPSVPKKKTGGGSTSNLHESDPTRKRKATALPNMMGDAGDISTGKPVIQQTSGKKYMFGRPISLMVKRNDVEGSPTSTYPVFRTLRPGDVVTAKAAFEACGLPFTDHATCTWNTALDLLNAIILKEPYKNDTIGVRKAWEKVCKSIPFLRFWFGGSGGSALMVGSHPLALKDTKKKEMHGATAACDQDPQEKRNCVCLTASARGKIVMIFVTAKMLGLEREDPNGENLYYIGLGNIASFALGEDDPASLWEETNLISKADRGYMSWRQRRHFKFYVEPISVPPGADDSWRNITIASNDKRQIVLAVKESIVAEHTVVNETDIINNFISSKNFLNYVDCNDDEWDESACLPNQHNLRLTPKDLVDAALRINVAGAYRYFKKNLVGAKAGSLTGDPKYLPLGRTVRSSCFLMSVRTLDPCTLLYLQSYASKCLDFNQTTPLRLRRLHVNKIDVPLFADLLLGTIILRTTGRPLPLQHFALWMRKEGVECPSHNFLPRVNDIPHFITFLMMTVKRKMLDDPTQDKLNDWIAGNLRASLPWRLNHLESYKTFLCRLCDPSFGATHLMRVATQILALPTKDRLEATLEFLRAIYSPFMDESEKASQKVEFVVYQNISDLEELIRELFQEEHVSPGYGAKQGLSILDVVERSTDESKLDSVVTEIQNRDSEFLSCLGLTSDDDGVLNKVNGRPLGRREAEQKCCKVAVNLSKTRGTRAVNRPRSSVPHCWPSKADCTGTLTEIVDGIMMDMIESYESLASTIGGWPVIPDEFLVPGETRPSPFVVTFVETL